MRVKVSLMGDICRPIPLSFTFHDAPCFEMPTPMMWPPGRALQQNKLTTTVFHKSQFVVLRGHDCGCGIPHVTIPLNNPKLPLIIAFSKRKIAFSCSTVKANGSQVGCTELVGPVVSLPMVCCGSPASLPTGFPLFNSLHTVSVAATVGDVVAGFIAIALDIVSDFLSKSLKLSEGGLDGLAGKLLGASTPQEWGLKMAFGLLAGAARIALTREGKLKVEVGSGYAGLEASAEAMRDGRLKLGTEAHAATMNLGHAYLVNNNGTTSHQFTRSAMTCEGIDSTQSTTTRGSQGKLVERKVQRTIADGSVNTRLSGPSDATASSWQQTTTTPANGSATTTTAAYSDSSPAGSWGMPL